MPFFIEHKQELDLVVAQMRGVVDDSVFNQYILETECLKTISAETNLLLLLNPDVDLKVSSSLIREMSRRPPVFALDALRVIVAPSDIGFGLSRMFSQEAPTASEQYMVVQTLAEASGLLGVDAVGLSQKLPET